LPTFSNDWREDKNLAMKSRINEVRENTKNVAQNTKKKLIPGSSNAPILQNNLRTFWQTLSSST
jgi:hypothetical protein